MPRKKTKTVYTFEELSPGAKDVAIRDWQESGHAWEQWDTESLTEYFKEELEMMGLPGDDIQWSLSSSQGDGVSFFGEIDLPLFFKKKMPKLEVTVKGSPAATPGKYWRPEQTYRGDLVALANRRDLSITGRIVRDPSIWHGYTHEFSMLVDLEMEPDEDMSAQKLEYLDAITTHLEKAITDRVREIARDLESKGYAEIEYRSSDEAISETLIANDFEFDKEGNRE